MKHVSWLVVVLCLSLHAAAADAATLSITTTGPNTGNVSVHGLGMLCGFSAGTGTTCHFTIPDGTAIKLVANSPSTPGVFSGGTGDAVACATTVCFFTLTQDSAVTATFGPGPHKSITFLLAGDGKGEVGADNSRCQNFELGYSACTIYYVEGSPVRLEGRSMPGNLFTGFSGGTNDAVACATGPCDFIITTDSVVTASFAALTSVQVSPATATLDVGGSQSFGASGNFSNGGTRSLQTGAGFWNSKVQMGLPRYSLAAAALGSYIYAVGGIADNAAGPSSRLERYSLGSGAFNFDSWSTSLPSSSTPLAAMPTPREGLAAIALDGKLYAFGGHTSGGIATATMEAYDPAANAWTSKAALPIARTWPAAAVIDGILYAVGGGEQAAPLDVLEAYDPVTDTWTTRAPMPTARTGAAAAVVDGILYAIGGFNGGNLAVVEAYDPATDTWSTRTPMPTPRTLLEAGVVDGIIYAIGGTNGPGLGTVESYDPATNAWTTMQMLPQGRSQFGLAVMDGRIWIAGGLTGGSTFIAALHDFRPPELTWRSSNAAVATVSSFGLVNGVGAGTATIIARAAGMSCSASGVCGTVTVGALPPPPPPPSGPIVYGGGEAHAVDSFLSYQGIGGIISILPSGTTELPLTIRYGAAIKPNTLKVYFDGQAVGEHFHPAPGSNESIAVPLTRGLHVLYLEIDGTVNGRAKTDRDLLLLWVR